MTFGLALDKREKSVYNRLYWQVMRLASGLRAKLKAMGATVEAPKKEVRRGGLLTYVERRDVEPGLLDLSAVGLRRIGWSGRPFDVRKCLFLDTETTGLSGGAGTVAFLVGAGYLKENALVIEQYLMRDYSDEPELIDRLANLMEDFDCVCTFNGRTFDMPLLEARFTMCRMRHRWREMENLDLLHPARRTWKLRLGSCRLSHLEEKIFGLERTGDIPGSEVPQRYFDFLKTGNMSLLEDVISHNRQDIATLATLLVKLCCIYDKPECLREKKDLFSVGKALERQGELKPARELYRVSAIPAPAGTIAALTGDRLSGEANWRIYQIERRSGNLEAMRAILEQMLVREQMPCAVRIELSKFFEHRKRDYRTALRYAREARRICASCEADALDKRIARLEKKLEKQ